VDVVTFHESYLTASDGTRLRTRHFEPVVPASTTLPRVLILHGWGDCTERHLHVAAAFAARGFHGVLYDQRGHGLSGGRPGDFESYSQLTSDFHAVLATTAPHPVIVAAFSFGGQVALNALHATPVDRLAALALVSPWFRLSVRAPLHKLVLAHIGRLIVPGQTQTTPLTPDDLSSDGAWLTTLAERAGSQMHKLMSARAYFFALNSGLAAFNRANSATFLGGCPLFTAHGTADTVTDHTATLEFHTRYPAPMKSHFQYDGWRHELQNERHRKEFLDDLVNWSQRVASQSTQMIGN
jgi:alpha-beta hydrolase superfamily lysophospholipase